MCVCVLCGRACVWCVCVVCGISAARVVRAMCVVCAVRVGCHGSCSKLTLSYLFLYWPMRNELRCSRRTGPRQSWTSCAMITVQWTIPRPARFALLPSKLCVSKLWTLWPKPKPAWLALLLKYITVVCIRIPSDGCQKLCLSTHCATEGNVCNDSNKW